MTRRVGLPTVTLRLMVLKISIQVDIVVNYSNRVRTILIKRDCRIMHYIWKIDLGWRKMLLRRFMREKRKAEKIIMFLLLPIPQQHPTLLPIRKALIMDKQIKELLNSLEGQPELPKILHLHIRQCNKFKANYLL
jgi:hypothetical protein